MSNSGGSETRVLVLTDVFLCVEPGDGLILHQSVGGNVQMCSVKAGLGLDQLPGTLGCQGPH